MSFCINSACTATGRPSGSNKAKSIVQHTATSTPHQTNEEMLKHFFLWRSSQGMTGAYTLKLTPLSAVVSSSASPAERSSNLVSPSTPYSLPPFSLPSPSLLPLPPSLPSLPSLSLPLPPSPSFKVSSFDLWPCEKGSAFWSALTARPGPKSSLGGGGGGGSLKKHKEMHRDTIDFVRTEKLAHVATSHPAAVELNGMQAAT